MPCFIATCGIGCYCIVRQNFWIMSYEKKNALWVLIGMVVMAALFMLIGFMAGKAKYDKPIVEKVERDTITLWDTIPHYYPQPVDGTEVKKEFYWLTRVDTTKDTLTLHDSVLVEVPITSKHYHADEYDAYVSGFEPNLDSIFVRQRTEYITETITKSKPPDKWELDIVGGINYGISAKQWQPYVGGELTLNNHKRLKIGIEGGVKRNEATKNFEPYAGIKGKIAVF